jgi:hypothetical protein
MVVATARCHAPAQFLHLPRDSATASGKHAGCEETIPHPPYQD